MFMTVTSPNVKKIFEMAYEGKGISDIVSYLNDNNILSPSIQYLVSFF